MKICFTLDDVIRAKTQQLGKTYKQFVNPNIDLNSLEFPTNDYAEIFGFDGKSEYNNFLYNQYAYEIFAKAPVTEKMIDKGLNLWLLKLPEIAEDYEGENPTHIDTMIANPMEFNASIGYTCFFLSKMATRIREFYFPLDSLTIWDKCDVLITADPKLLENKPKGKISIKIETSYNKDLLSDYTYDSLQSFIDDENIIKNLIEKCNGN